MKKLLIAAALTASVCSFGANINATGFEADNSLADGYFNKGANDASEVKSYEEGAAPAAAKATAAGAAYLAGLAVGFFKDRSEIKQLLSSGKRFSPLMGDEERAHCMQGWHRAIRACRVFAEGEETV